jgi:hypothetical protein
MCMSDYIHYSSDDMSQRRLCETTISLFNPGNHPNPSKFSFSHVIEFVPFHRSHSYARIHSATKKKPNNFNPY